MNELYDAHHMYWGLFEGALVYKEQRAKYSDRSSRGDWKF